MSSANALAASAAVILPSRIMASSTVFWRCLADVQLTNGLYSVGPRMIPASIEACARSSLLVVVWKYILDAAAVPQAVLAKKTLLRYHSRIWSLVYLRSIWKARSASRILRSSVASLPTSLSLTSCCVIVEAPSTFACDCRSTIDARTMPWGSMPGSE